MQKAEANLAELIDKSRQMVRRADQAESSGRCPTVPQLLDYAERVSHSNAAPVSTAAFEAAQRKAFRGGWGAPAPQQHMLAVSRFAMMHRAGAPKDDAGAAPEDAAPAAKRARLDAPAFKAAASQLPGSALESASLDDDLDDDLFE
mmetsp:Transcript_72114/g.191661  ORF Transcript_72114/g.191661 Transcript_72114/m.191661 type:complete len:146 (+) Transcript_72114:3-440(+)